MKKLFLTILIFNIGFLVSQTKHPKIKVSLHVSPAFDKITVVLIADSVSLNNCKVEVTDAKKNIVIKVDLPKSANHIVAGISIVDLLPGDYTCLVYKGKEELYRKEFLKDESFDQEIFITAPK